MSFGTGDSHDVKYDVETVINVYIKQMNVLLWCNFTIHNQLEIDNEFLFHNTFIPFQYDDSNFLYIKNKFNNE